MITPTWLVLLLPLLLVAGGCAGPGFISFPDNLRLRPDSPAVDAADPQADYSQELGYNGGRADMGAYGNTMEAAFVM